MNASFHSVEINSENGVYNTFSHPHFMIITYLIFQQKRTEFSPEQVEMMKEAYEKGMRKGKTWASGQQELALKLNLTEVQVKVIR